MCALWTRSMSVISCSGRLKSEGYNVFAPIDCVGGTSKEAHNAALSRIQQAGARLTSLTQLSCEWQRLE